MEQRRVFIQCKHGGPTFVRCFTCQEACPVVKDPETTPSPSAQPVAVRDRLQKWLDRANPFDQLYLPRAAITQILAALDAHPAPSAQPDAVRQAIPREPTEAMLKAAFNLFELRISGYATGNDARRAIWQAMYDAALASSTVAPEGGKA